MSNEHTNDAPRAAAGDAQSNTRAEGSARSRGRGQGKPRAQQSAHAQEKPSSEGGSGEQRSQSRRRRNTTRHKTVSVEHKRPQITPEDQMEKESFSKPRTRNASKTTEGARRRSGVKKNPAAKLKIIPLGGLDAIGKNMTVFECGDDMLLVDAGLMFPDDDHPGIDLILPDYTYVLENEHKLRGIIITHGHEDHTGSLPYLMKDLSR